MRLTMAHEYQSSKLKWALMNEFFTVAFSGDGNMILLNTQVSVSYDMCFIS